MKIVRKAALVGSFVALAFGTSVLADEDANLVVNGDIEIPVRVAAPEGSPLPELISGWVFRSSETQKLQMDDFENPAFPAVDAAWENWGTVDGSAGKACADCHGEPASMKGLRTVMPKFNADKGEMWTLEMYINNCRTERMGAEKWGWNSGSMVNMTALISSVSRGMPIAVQTDGPAAPYWEKGKEIYYTRFGQLELSCANCHEDHYGDYIRADHLSQGQINGFPTYRLKNAKLNSIHNRFKGCIRDTRAETYKEGSPEFIALEVYVASRGNGLYVEGPSVRN
jgi:sulfur-oxidizing protein SoxA